MNYSSELKDAIKYLENFYDMGYILENYALKKIAKDLLIGGIK